MGFIQKKYRILKKEQETPVNLSYSEMELECYYK